MLILAWLVRLQEGFITFAGWQGHRRGPTASSWQLRNIHYL